MLKIKKWCSHRFSRVQNMENMWLYREIDKSVKSYANMKILGHWRQFFYITSPKISEISHFLGKRLYYLLELFFGTFWQSLRKILWTDFPQSGKNCQKWLFFAQMSGFRENRQKSKKSGQATFLTFFTPNFVPSFRKILGAVSEIIRDRQTDTQTHRSDFIGPSRFSTGDQQEHIL